MNLKGTLIHLMGYLVIQYIFEVCKLLKIANTGHLSVIFNVNCGEILVTHNLIFKQNMHCT